MSTPSGYTALHLACLTGHVGVVGLLLSRSTDLLKVTDAAGQTAIHVAASNGHHEMCQVAKIYIFNFKTIFRCSWVKEPLLRWMTMSSGMHYTALQRFVCVPSRPSRSPLLLKTPYVHTKQSVKTFTIGILMNPYNHSLPGWIPGCGGAPHQCWVHHNREDFSRQNPIVVCLRRPAQGVCGVPYEVFNYAHLNICISVFF